MCIRDSVGSLYLTEIRLLQEIGSKFAQVKSGAIKAQELLDLPAFAGGAPFPAKSDVRLENVRFSYDGTREVLHGVNLAVQQGERLAVVGPSEMCIRDRPRAMGTFKVSR